MYILHFFFFWQLYFLFFFGLRLLITPVVSENFSHRRKINHATMYVKKTEFKLQSNMTYVVRSVWLNLHITHPKTYITGTTSGTWTAYPSVTSEFTRRFKWGMCCSIFSFLCHALADHCLSFFVICFFKENQREIQIQKHMTCIYNLHRQYTFNLSRHIHIYVCPFVLFIMVIVLSGHRFSAADFLTSTYHKKEV